MAKQPTKWAMERAREIFQSDKSYGFVWNARLANEIALALDEARQQGEESEREERHKCEAALRAKDKAMGVLFDRLDRAGVDCSDLYP